MLVTSLVKCGSGLICKNNCRVFFRLRQTFSRIKQVKPMLSTGSIQAQPVRYNKILPISTAAQPNTSSSKCQLSTCSFWVLPNRSLYTAAPLTNTPSTASAIIPSAIGNCGDHSLGMASDKIHTEPSTRITLLTKALNNDQRRKP